MELKKRLGREYREAHDFICKMNPEYSCILCEKFGECENRTIGGSCPEAKKGSPEEIRENIAFAKRCQEALWELSKSKGVSLKDMINTLLVMDEEQ